MSQYLHVSLCLFRSLAICLISLLVGCDGSILHDRNRPQFTVRITDLLVAEASTLEGWGRPIQWLDNRWLLVNAIDMPKREVVTSAGHTAYANGLYLLDSVTGKSQKYFDLAGTMPQICYFKGNIWYRSKIDVSLNQTVHYEGVLGKEVEISEAWKRDEEINDDLFLNRLSCNMQSRKSSLRPEHREPGHGVVFLRKGDGYIYVGKSDEPGRRGVTKDNQDMPVHLYKEDGSAPIPLPIKAKEMGHAYIRFSEYANQYVIEPHIPESGQFHIVSWPLELPHIVYFLSPEGKIKKEEFPLKPRIGSYLPYPTTQGYFFPGGVISTNSKDSGGWIYKNGSFNKLYDHVTTEVSASPDGCRVAVTVSYDEKIPSHTIRIIDFCMSGKSEDTLRPPRHPKATIMSNSN